MNKKKLFTFSKKNGIDINMVGNMKNKKTINYKFWLEEDKKILFGSGGTLLLAEIEKGGSLSNAAKELNMSYRAAWGRLKKMEDHLKIDLVVKLEGNKKGYSLTDDGRKFLLAYKLAEKKLDKYMISIQKEFFPWLD